MYINKVHILYYVAFVVLGLIVGQFINWCNIRLPEYKKVFSKDLLKKEKRSFKTNYWVIVIMAIIYVGLLYKFGIDSNWINNLGLIKYMLLTPMLISAFVIDYRLQIIPNRLTLTMFEIGLLFTFIYGIFNINIAINMLLGMLAGGGIFLIITLIGGLLAGKEAMGFGDVKLMGALGLYFGLVNIVTIAIMSFLIGAIISIVLLVSKIRKVSEYIPFGPFIVIATFISIFIPFGTILTILLEIFTLGMYA